ncbi:DNA topoisomerase IV [Echinicola jeungdonensis]|uniref:DNA topoisomerase IV n=1 Tax=Echinicola jeungdonensis TaxID=709343 RepID=A0ABV5J5K6_9BACT|nr:DNA topoisomerase IV [Echinicola jeungdonensis]MDN3670911.1 DNA topoisomerase IV [Echinicola jeungdonensis]
MYYRFAKAFHLLTVLFFIVTFLYLYSGLPEKVILEVDEFGEILKTISRNTFFYTGIGVFVILNLLLVTPAKMIENKTSRNLRKLFEVGDPSRDQILSWIYSFVGIINVSIVVIAFYIHNINRSLELGIENNSQFLMYVLPIFFVIWIVMLFVILTRKIRQVKSSHK